MKYLILSIWILTGTLLYAQNEKFTLVKEVKHLPVLNQGSTGTCWSFATTSFLEAEIIRKGLPETDLSEMFFVNHAYRNKIKHFLYFHGNNNFGQGGLAHDVMDVVREHGVLRYESYPGIKIDGRFQHRSLARELKELVLEENKATGEFKVQVTQEMESVLRESIGKLPKTKDKVKLKKKLKINPDDYVELSSYTHHPFYKPFVLEVPDNWSHDLYYNVPIDELMGIMYHALENGFSVCWDGDVSEKLFQHKNGKADLPARQLGKVNQELRQETFINRKTTDDHLMHLVGISKDSEGRSCFYTKNSWGADSNDYGGYLHMTDDYVRLKTVAILVHKDAIPKKIRAKLNL